MNGKIDDILSFHGSLGRPLTLIEICRLSGETPADVISFLEKAIADGSVLQKDGFYILKKCGKTNGLDRRLQDFLLQKKWRKFLKLRLWFNAVPFLDFVFASGSMALGNVTPVSDFDVLVGVRPGRLFTTRYLTLLVFTLLGRRRADDKEDSSPDRFCFNHFVTPEIYGKPPFNLYRKELYGSLVPVYGSEGKILEFAKANTWAGAAGGSLSDLRFKSKRFNFLRWFLEFVLGGKLGNYLENKVLAPIAKKRLEKYISSRPNEGRVVVSDRELEFHFNLPYEK